ncbi:SDR family oxidoreductase [Phenylobacterium sp.]|uniref:SDR family oxidoreductase n=1 Tax=Phenylobacterium sp. TaxID=1871053 RepID=UPI00301D615B
MGGDAFLAGKSAFVAGGSSGINLAIAQGLAAAGASVGLVSRSADKIGAAAAAIRDAGGTAMGIPADVRDYGAVAEAVGAVRDAHGEIDIVVSGAAGNFLAAAAAMSANAFRTVVEIDLIGTFNVLHAAYPHLRRPGASLISISAGQAVRPMMFQTPACAAKAGVNMVTKCLAMEWGPEGVRVNAISPGPIGDTEGMARLTPTPEAEAALKGRIPLRDYGAKRDVTEVALFLCSDAARYITGTVIDCDGGWILGDASGDLSQPRLQI